MLTITASVNGRWIAGMNIVNVADLGGDLCRYKCSTEGAIWYVEHNRSDGAWKLTQKAIEAMPGDSDE